MGKVACHHSIAILSLDWSETSGSGSCARELAISLRAKQCLVGVGNVEVVDPCHIEELTDWRPRWSIIARGRRIIRLAQGIRRTGATVVIVNTGVQASAVIAARLAGAPVIWHSHESGVAFDGVIMRLRRCVYRSLCVLVVAPSLSGLACAGDKVVGRVIRNSILPGGLAARGEHPGSLAVVGRKTRAKGIDRLPDIVRRIDLVRRNMCLEVVGPEAPEDRRWLARVERELADILGDRLRWSHGAVNRDEVLSRASVALIPSRTDTRPRIAEEALLRGVPVLSGPLPGLQEIADQAYDHRAVSIADATPGGWLIAFDRALAFSKVVGGSLTPGRSQEQYGADWYDLIHDEVARCTPTRRRWIRVRKIDRG